MNTHRKTATIVGILFLICTAAALISFPFSGPLLEDPNYLIKLSGSESSVIVGAIFEFIWAITCAGIAIALYPVLKKYNHSLALGSVAFRLTEGIFVLIAALSLLTLLTLSQEFVTTGAENAVALQTSGTLLLGIRDWAHNVFSPLAFASGAIMYYVLLYKSKLIPRWLSGWGLLGAVLAVVATLLGLLTNDFGLDSINTYLNIPIGLNEMVLAIWLITKGFNSSAIASWSSEEV